MRPSTLLLTSLTAASAATAAAVAGRAPAAATEPLCSIDNLACNSKSPPSSGKRSDAALAGGAPNPGQGSNTKRQQPHGRRDGDPIQDKNHNHPPQNTRRDGDGDPIPGKGKDQNDPSQNTRRDGGGTVILGQPGVNAPTQPPPADDPLADAAAANDAARNAANRR